MPMTAASRLARAIAGAALSTFVALGSHILAGGAMPGAAGLAVPLLLSTALCFQFAGRALSLWRLTVAVVASQWIFHQLFMLGSGDVGITATGGVHAGHAGGSLAVHGGPGTHAAGGMTLSHAMAALVTVVAIFKAEQLIAALARGAARARTTLRDAVLSSLHLPSPDLRAVPLVTTVAPWRRWPVPLAVASAPLSRRGPPLLHG